MNKNSIRNHEQKNCCPFCKSGNIERDALLPYTGQSLSIYIIAKLEAKRTRYIRIHQCNDCNNEFTRPIPPPQKINNQFSTTDLNTRELSKV